MMQGYRCRLKAQMVAEQEEEEGSLQWRIDAEVQLALQEAKAGEASRLADLEAKAAALEAALDKARLHEAELAADARAWQDALPAKDAEIQNLQVGPNLYQATCDQAGCGSRLCAVVNTAVAKLQETATSLATSSGLPA